MSGVFSIRNLTERTDLKTQARFLRIKNKTVGKAFSVSLVFAGAAYMRRLNRDYRNKAYTPNVLAFRLAKNEGEIFVCPSVAAREAHLYQNGTFGQARASESALLSRIEYLFIHGLLHLKGCVHGVTMSESEKRLCKVFKLPELDTIYRGAKNLLRN